MARLQNVHVRVHTRAPRSHPHRGSAPAHTCTLRSSKSASGSRGAAPRARRFRGKPLRFCPNGAILPREGGCCRREAGRHREARAEQRERAGGPQRGPAASSSAARHSPQPGTRCGHDPRVMPSVLWARPTGDAKSAFGTTHRTRGQCCRCTPAPRDHRSRSCLDYKYTSRNRHRWSPLCICTEGNGGVSRKTRVRVFTRRCSFEGFKGRFYYFRRTSMCNGSCS